MAESSEDLREIVKFKAQKHRSYFKSLIGDCQPPASSTTETPQMAEVVPTSEPNTDRENRPVSPQHNNDDSQATMPVPKETESVFKSVKNLRENYLDNLTLDEPKTPQQHDNAQSPQQRTNDIVETLPVPPSSGYCSSSGASDDERATEKTIFQKVEVRRSASSDSAMGQSEPDDEHQVSPWEEQEVPYQLSVVSPYSPRGSIDHSNVPSKTILEAKFVPLPLDRKLSLDYTNSEEGDFDLVPGDSRRQSCFTDDGDEQPRYRFWRTPSVVVSDYSDDLAGLSLEDIEYIRDKNKENSSSAESSLHSSCSNLNYCGSAISGLEADYVLTKPYRKSSNCSTCSTLSGDEEDAAATLHPAKNKEPSAWRKLRNIVQWTPFFQTYKKQRYPWVQLAGHQGNFKAGPDQGTILKKLCAKEEKCFKLLMNDVLRPYVPEYKGLVASDDGECEYIQLEDLLGDFVTPCVMDCKIGVRTYLEEELAKAKEKPKLRKDMYEKMCQIDQNAPTEEEHKLKGVTKPRYMVWRETISSTATLGFRIEGIRNADGTSSKDFKTTKTKEQVIKAFEKFTDGFPHAIPKYIQRLKAIKACLATSDFFSTHEVIGSSLLFVHDKFNANVWLIDFAKTVKLPENVKITHNSKWKVGNHEDGYLIGIENLIKIFMTMLEQQPVPVSPPLALQDPPELQSQEKQCDQESNNT